MINIRAIAVQGFGFGSLYTALQGFVVGRIYGALYKKPDITARGLNIGLFERNNESDAERFVSQETVRGVDNMDVSRPIIESAGRHKNKPSASRLNKPKSKR